ncbi:MAG: prenyltransferase/squalene oxidase repeat-containing protein, partial [Planctomycetia bacterium]
GDLSMHLLPMSGRFGCTVAWSHTLVLAGGAAANDSRIDDSIERGLDWLEAAQQPDGSWGSGAFRGSAAVTATCTMAMVGSGSTPSEGPRARAVARAVSFLLASAGGSGLIAGREQAAHGPMYGHAFATIALAELYGETDDDAAVASALEAARRLIERTQNDEGGWRYQPLPRDADISVTAAMLNALRALRNAGFDVSAEAVDRAVAYLRRLQNADGGFRYQSSAGPSASPRTAAALFALVAAGGGKEEAVRRGFEWLDAHPVKLGTTIRLESGDGYALYGLAATAAALWQRGDADWESWYPATAATLVAAQRDDGSWQDPSCAEYGTSAALTVLQTPKDLTPLYQRDRPSP